MLNEEDIEKYTKRGGGHCPYCDSDDLSEIDFVTDHGVLYLDVTCQVCLKTWREQMF